MEPHTVISTGSKIYSPISKFFKYVKNGVSKFKQEQKFETYLINLLNSEEAKKIEQEIKENPNYKEIDFKLANSLVANLTYQYEHHPLFNDMYFFGNSQIKLELEKDFVQLSYINQTDQKKRETKEQKERMSNILSDSYQNFIQYDYLTNEVVQVNNKIFVIGKPGVGKSVFAKKYCRDWANSTQIENKIPIYIPLKDLNFSNSINILFDYIRSTYLSSCQYSADEIKEFLRYLHPLFVFVLDGFDELNRSKQRVLKNEMESVFKDTQNYILFTRPYGLIDATGWHSSFSLSIDGFSENNIENYIKNVLDKIDLDKSKTTEELISIIKNNNVLKENAEVPLLLSYMVLLYINENNDVLKYIDNKYELHRLVQKGLKEHYAAKNSLNYDIESSRLKQIAYDLTFLNEFYYKVQPTEKDLFEIFCTHGLGTSKETAVSEIEFTFNSFTFQEFYTAEYLSSQNISLELLIYLARYYNYWNVLLLLTGAVNNNKPNLINAFLTHLTKQNKDYYLYLYTLVLAECSSEMVNNEIEKHTVKNKKYVTYINILDYYYLNQKTSSSASFPIHKLIPYALNLIYQKLEHYNKINFIDRIIHNLLTETNTIIKNKDDEYYLNSNSYIELIKIINLQNNEQLLIGVLTNIEKLIGEIEDVEKFYPQINQYLEILVIFDKKLFTDKRIKSLLNEIFDRKIKDYFFNVFTFLNVHNENLEISFDDLEKEISQYTIENSVIEQYNNPSLKKISRLLYILSNSQHTSIDIINRTINLIVENQNIIINLCAYNTMVEDISDDNDAYDEYQMTTINTLLLNGLNKLSSERLYELIVFLTYLNYPLLESFDITNNKEYIKYVKANFDDYSLLNNCNNLDEEKFKTFMSLIVCTKNLNNNFYKIKDTLFNAINIYIEQHKEAFQKISSFNISPSDKEGKKWQEQVKVLDNLLMMFYENKKIYSFDRKTLFDHILKYKYAYYKYFKEHFIPSVLSEDIEIFQESYISYLSEYLNESDFKYLLSILRNNSSIFDYYSNLPFLNTVLQYIVDHIDENFITEQVFHLKSVEVAYKTLQLVFKNKIISDTKKEETIILIEKILSNTSIQSNKNSIIQYSNGETYAIYTLMFIFSKKDKYSCLDETYSQLTYNDKSNYFFAIIEILKYIEHSTKENLIKLLGRDFERTYKNYIEYHDYLNQQFEKDKLDQLLTNEL